MRLVSLPPASPLLTPAFTPYKNTPTGTATPNSYLSAPIVIARNHESLTHSRTLTSLSIPRPYV